MRRRLVAFALLALLGAGCRPHYMTIRPGCTFRVTDEDTGLPIPDAKITVVTLNAERDTVGKWNLRTDDLGLAGMATIRERKRREVAAVSKLNAYEFVAGLQAEGYQYYSLRIAPGLVVVRLSRGFSVACSPPTGARSPLTAISSLPAVVGLRFGVAGWRSARCG